MRASHGKRLHPTLMRLAPMLLALTVYMPLSIAHAQTTATPTGIVTLASLRHTARPLLIFAPAPNDPQLQIQLRRLHLAAPAIVERDVVIIVIPWQSPSPTQAALTSQDALAARHRFHIAPTDFTVILIGKDGGEKLRSSKPLTLEKLLDTIDAMPMRQEEMR
jgi:hypothetical protein